MAGLLAIDVGNTQTVFGLYDGTELREHWRVSTEVERTGDELGLLLRGLVDLGSLEGLALACTVPPLVRAYEEFAEREGVTLLVASLADIIRSKKAARRPRDLAIMDILEKALEENARVETAKKARRPGTRK